MHPRRLLPVVLFAGFGLALVAPPGAIAQLEAGDRLRLASESWSGEGTLIAIRSEGLLLAPEPNPGGAVLQVPISQIESLLVARARSRTGPILRHALVGALLTGSVGAFVGGRSEYGTDGAIGVGLALAIPGAIIGAASGAFSGTSRVRWEEVSLPLVPPSPP